jgi:AsmA family protein
MTPISIRSTGMRWLAAMAAVLIALLFLIAFFPWDLLRQPINRYVSGQLGRRFEITRHLDVKLGRTTTVIADGVEIANPEWARKALLLKATSAEFDIRVWPLLFGKVQIPRIALKSPELGLQAESDGRRTWALSRDTADAGAAPDIGSFLVDQGTLSYIAAAQGADIAAQFSIASESARELPLDFKATGKWKGEKFTADGRTGGVLKLSKNIEGSFPLQVNALVGRTSLKASGTLTDLAELAGVDVSFDLQGRNLDELYKLTGVVLPSTPPYKVRGKLLRQGDAWKASQMQGTLGSSDINGALTFDQSAEVAMLTGKLQSKLLDFEDLAPVIGLAPSARPAKPAASAPAAAPSAGPQEANVKARAQALAQAAQPAAKATRTDPSRKVLPTAVLDLAKLKSMNADVTYSAADIRHVKELPLDKGSLHVLLKNGVLQLDPISLGVAGGSIAGSIKIDSNLVPAAFNARLDVRGAQLNQLFPTVETTKSSLGKISGKFDLNGRGNSAAQMLGGASGDVAVLMGKGQLSNILLEFMGLDGGEIIKFLVRGDRNVQLRCAAAAFDVKQGVMTSRAIVLDTSDTVINGQGQVSFANETLDIVLNPAPKDVSILSFRSPLRIGGTFAAPTAFPDKAALAGRAGIALALAAINPLLALAATVETGPGQDADCAGVFAEAQKGKASARSASPGLKAVK